MNIYIVRHGQTEENQQRILQGHLPGKLTAVGQEQVHQTALRLAASGTSFSAIISSDLQRALDSAHILSQQLHLPVTPTPTLRERDWGSYTGMPIAQAQEQFYHEGRWDFPLTDHPAETEEQLATRATLVLQQLRTQYAGQNILVVTHGLFARFLIAAHFNCPFRQVQPLLNAEVRVLQVLTPP